MESRDDNADNSLVASDETLCSIASIPSSPLNLTDLKLRPMVLELHDHQPRLSSQPNAL